MQGSRWQLRLTLALAAFSSLACEASTEPFVPLADISRVRVEFVPAGGGAALTASIEDPDGTGPLASAGQVGALVFQPGTTYTGRVTLENHLASPVLDVTEDVIDRGDEYRLYHRVAGSLTGAGFIVTPTDTDAAGRPLGLEFTAAVNELAGGDTGRFELVLCRYNRGLKSGLTAECAGEALLTVTFEMVASGGF